MIELFKSNNINLTLAKALEKDNIITPTEIQSKVIPEAIKNKDLIVQSETGTGKTLAFLLPIFAKIDPAKKEMQAIILAPTHELAMQIIRQIERLSQNSEIKATSAPIIGNVNIDRQIDKLKEKPNILVGSPGRVLELIKKKKISAHTIKTIVLDEADRLLDINNIENVKAIIKSTMKDRQLMVFSATMAKEAKQLATELMKEPEFIKTEGTLIVPTTIEHLYFVAEERDKIEVLRKLVRILNPKKALAFIGEKDEIDLMVEKLKFHKINADGLHGKNIKLDRKKTMDDFKSGKTQVLLASDIAARGLDIEDLTHIFSLNMPEDPRDYLHRAGRTGRKGNSGVCISIITEREVSQLKSAARALNISITAKDMYKGEIIDRKEKVTPKSNVNKSKNIKKVSDATPKAKDDKFKHRKGTKFKSDAPKSREEKRSSFGQEKGNASAGKTFIPKAKWTTKNKKK